MAGAIGTFAVVLGVTLVAVPAAGETSGAGRRGFSDEFVSCRVARPRPAGTIDARFSPYGNGEGVRLVVQAIESARERLDVAAYALTSGTIQQALETAARCGVGVRLVLDAREATRLEETGRLARLKAAGVLVRASEPGLTMHDKIVIADRATVQTGSFNYIMPKSGANIETVIVLWGNIPLSLKFGQHFDEVWSRAGEL
jgi:phosphatidylserine/phosphatidylglycerophosphate/cardiolipin synthase-like enzyme